MFGLQGSCSPSRLAKLARVLARSKSKLFRGMPGCKSSLRPSSSHHSTALHPVQGHWFTALTEPWLIISEGVPSHLKLEVCVTLRAIGLQHIFQQHTLSAPPCSWQPCQLAAAPLPATPAFCAGAALWALAGGSWNTSAFSTDEHHACAHCNCG